jgi:hypothetical protein
MGKPLEDCHLDSVFCLLKSDICFLPSDPAAEHLNTEAFCLEP